LINSEPADPVSLIAQAWQVAGKRAPTPVAVGQEGCVVPSCSADGWVRLKTQYGPVAVCFSHFQSVRGLAG